MLADHVMNIVAKIADWVKRHRQDLWVALCVALATWSAYNVGHMRGLQEAQIASPGELSSGQGNQTPEPQKVTIRKATSGPVHTDPRVVASKSGTKYHFTWCPGASTIKEANRLWFDTAEAAEAQGYTLAGNCKK